MAPNLVQPRKSHLVWPAIPSVRVATLLSLQYQFEQSQWWSPEDLKRQQFNQLRLLLEYSYRHIPFYRKRLKAAGFNPGKKVTDDLWARIPTLTRSDIQDAGEGLTHEPVPEDHGTTFVIRTSGSTGTPVKVVKTDLCDNFFKAAALRHHLWHPRDFSGVHCSIRDAEAILGWDNIDDAKYPKGKNWDHWGQNIVFPTGKAAMLYIHTAIEDQVKWLKRKKPSVLLTFPSNLREIVKYCAQKGIRFENLKSIDTISEVITPDLRDAVREVWGLTITDMYTAAEIGYIALQCPEFEHYHIQSELVHVEILDDEDRPCEPGQTGRVVVTPLHNVATPLIRYEVGDFAEAGAPCPCGRGLPVIKQVFGRVRNMLRYPNGNQVWPNFGWEDFYVNDSVQRFQVIQKTLEKIEVRLVCRSPLTGGDEDLIRQRLWKTLEYPFEIAFTYHETLERTRSGKFEDFKSEVGAPTTRADAMNVGNREVRLESPRTIIRAMTPADVTERFVSWFADSEVMAHLSAPMNLTREQLVGDLATFDFSTRFFFAIDWKKNGQQIGWFQALCGSGGSVKITHAIGERSYWGRGITTEFLTPLIEYFFEVVGLNKIVSRVYVDNVGSQKVNEKLGFRFEETVPGRGRRPNGGPYDVHLYGLLKRDWRAARDD